MRTIIITAACLVGIALADTFEMTSYPFSTDCTGTSAEIKAGNSCTENSMEVPVVGKVTQYAKFNGNCADGGSFDFYTDSSCTTKDADNEGLQVTAEQIKTLANGKCTSPPDNDQISMKARCISPAASLYPGLVSLAVATVLALVRM